MALPSNLSPPFIHGPLSPQLSLLDLIFPGFTNTTNAASQALSGSLTGYYQLMCLFALAAFLEPYMLRVKDWFIDHRTSTIHIQPSDETYHMVQSWISSRGYDDTARSILAKVRTKLNSAKKYDSRTKKSLCYAPWEGSTGKSSFSLSIASELDMDIYVVSIPSTNDQMLKNLFAALPDRCVVLLEDIDAAGAACSREPSAEDSDSDVGTKTQKNGVTLSGLLNVLDGVASQEDRVLVMTTNHPEKLDQALIRPGRVDKKVEFQLADRGIAKEIFQFIFSRADKKVEHISQEKECGEVGSHADEFATTLPESEFSPAEIISYLLPYRFCPAAAAANCSRWVAELRQEKQRKKRRLDG
ncbi:hypothetical protein E4U43_000815 [Claviceps pusilla]|uniref:BCS1 protein n=1 Tax=Claviceps pusilla TaxID=123648 RepID=A0A9P7NID1_9HYPO|nr:hypothetical protein E4U43_000815 [Claviceps pusilla]